MEGYLWIDLYLNTIKHNKTQQRVNRERIFVVNCINSLMGNNRQTCNISDTLVSSKIVDHSYVGGASPVGAAPTTSSFST